MSSAKINILKWIQIEGIKFINKVKRIRETIALWETPEGKYKIFDDELLTKTY